MSLLSLVSRAGPSVQRNLLSRVLAPQAPGTIDSVRGKKGQAAPPVPSASTLQNIFVSGLT